MAEAPVDKEALIELVDEDPAFLERLVDTFHTDCSEYVKAMYRAVEEDDAEALVQHAHGLRGAVANLHATPAERAARTVEEMGRDRALEDAEAVIGDLEAELDRLKRALRQVVKEVG